MDEGLVVGYLELRLHRFRVRGREAFGLDPFGPEQLEQGIERGEVPLPRPGEEAGRPEVAGEPGLLAEPLEELEALAGESDADPGFIVLPDEGAAVSRRARRDVALLQEDDVDVAASQLEGDAGPHAAAADHDDLGLPRQVRNRHPAPGWGSPLFRFPRFIFMFIDRYPSRRQFFICGDFR